MGEYKYFFSYARKDKDFVLKLAKELRAVGVNLWLDQLDILGGQRWDRAIEEALKVCQGMIVILSSEALASNNVMDEVSYALEKEKLVLPVLLSACDIPYRLRRLQHIDFTTDYNAGFSQLLKALGIRSASQPKEFAKPTPQEGTTFGSKPLEKIEIRSFETDIESKGIGKKERQKVEAKTKNKNEKNQLWNKLVKIVSESLSIDQSEVVRDASFIDDLGADELDMVELIMSFEEEFNVDISDEEAEKLLTVGEVYEYGIKKLGL